MLPTLRSFVVVTTLGLLLGVVAPAGAGVAVRGNVFTRNARTLDYDRLSQARLRLVLAEDTDWDTADVEGATNSNGYYNLTEGNAW